MDQKEPLNVIDLYEFSDDEHILPTFSYNINLSSTTINETEKIVELIILISGIVLNILVLLAIIIRNSMHTCTGCYLLNLVMCNFIALLDILGNVVDRWFDLNFKPDVDYINRVTLLVYICTVTVFSVDRYITFCCGKFPRRITLSEMSTVVKGIFVIWSFASIFTAMELHLYNKFRRETVINLYIFTTVMYIIMATIVVVILNIIIIIQRLENKVHNDMWGVKHSDSIRLLVGITVVFYLTLVPDRIITILHYKLLFCCSPIALSICYCVAKSSTIFGPLIWIGTSKILRKCIQDILFGRWKTSRTFHSH